MTNQWQSGTFCSVLLTEITIDLARAPYGGEDPAEVNKVYAVLASNSTSSLTPPERIPLSSLQSGRPPLSAAVVLAVDPATGAPVK